MDSVRWMVFVTTLLASCNVCEGGYKQWTANTNFASDKNWDTGHAPCGPVSVRIPELAPQIYVQLDTTIKELILPNHVELILGDGLNLVFSEQTPTNCQNPSTGDVNFIATSPEPWFNPDNWCPKDSLGGECSGTALLDTEQVPCKSDDVIFPDTSSYYVNLDSGYDITVGSLQMSGSSYTTQSFKSFLATDIGTRTFPPPSGKAQSSLTVLGTAQKCNDVTGCACGNDDKKISDKICGYKSSSCARPFCEKPLRPVGSCCDICGAILEMSYGTGFRFTFLRDSMKSSFITGKPNGESVSYIMSKRGDDKIQMVLSDTAGNNSLPFANAIKKAIDDDISNGGVKYGITSISLQVSHGAFKPPQAHTGSPLEGGQIAGIVIGLLVVVAIVLVIAFFVYRRRTSSLAFGGVNGFDVSAITKLPSTIRDKVRKFRQARSDVVPSMRFSDISSEHVQGIDNPMYGTGQVGTVVEMPRIQSYDETDQPSVPSGDKGFDNPLYDSVQESAFFADPSIHINPTFSTEGLDQDNM
ncbi:protein amnionless-like [Liolophura sinensis]|uniref:protein amnionless-like n=1 Tax=Liolophura sinensis TaxID=3198878 RepID=UPI003158E4E6